MVFWTSELSVGGQQRAHYTCLGVSTIMVPDTKQPVDFVSTAISTLAYTQKRAPHLLLVERLGVSELSTDSWVADSAGLDSS